MTEHRPRQPGEWITHSTIKEVYSSWWMTLRIDDVERPDGSHTAHEVVRGPDAAGIVVLSPTRGVLMIWRHRFMPDTWGWEIPGGALEPDEQPETAARRECLEETGWRVVGPTRHLSTHHPSVGLVNQTFHVYFASAADYVGKPSDPNEAALVAWLPIEQAIDALNSGSITDAFTQLGLTLALARAGYGPLFADSSWKTASEGTNTDVAL